MKGRKCKRRGCARAGRAGRALKRRYGCFHLPKVPGATVREAKRKDVSWLARTDPDAREIEFSEAWNGLKPEEKKYIVLHERAHLTAGPDHTDRFYEVLKKLVTDNGVSWRVAYELENFNCHKTH